MISVAGWTVTTPIMVMPDGSCRSFDTFTESELAEWAKRAQRRAMRAAGYIPVEDCNNDAAGGEIN